MYTSAVHIVSTESGRCSRGCQTCSLLYAAASLECRICTERTMTSRAGDATLSLPRSHSPRSAPPQHRHCTHHCKIQVVNHISLQHARQTPDACRIHNVGAVSQPAPAPQLTTPDTTTIALDTGPGHRYDSSAVHAAQIYVHTAARRSGPRLHHQSHYSTRSMGFWNTKRCQTELWSGRSRSILMVVDKQ